MRIVLPKSYDLVVGDTFQLFYRGVIEAADPFCRDILAVCEKGRNFPRYFEFTPEEEGCFPLTLTVSADDGTVLASGQTTLRVCSARKAPDVQKNILCIGDSLTARGIWVEEACRRLCGRGGDPVGLGFENLRFIGTCQRSEAGFEGYGGWRWQSYLSDVYPPGESAVWISCKTHGKTADDQHSLWQDEFGALWQLETIDSERLKFNPSGNGSHTIPPAGSRLTHCKNAANTADIVSEDSCYEHGNPFYDTEKKNVSFASYCRRNGFPGIDAVYFLLTWNGVFLSVPIEEHCRRLVEQGKTLVDILHREYPEALVRIMGLQVPSVTGGTGASYGASLPYCSDYGLTRLVMELNRAYEAWCLEPDYRSFMEFINVSGQFDSDYNMPWTQKPVNTRSTFSERIGTNGVHPLPEGYLQIADAAWRNMVKTFCQ